MFTLLLVVALIMVFVFGVQIRNRLDRIVGESLWCARGNHRIGNEPYTFIREDDYADLNPGKPVCLRCIATYDAFKAKYAEWNDLAEEEREKRRAKARVNGTCPLCTGEELRPDGSCRECLQHPLDINASMNRVWREREQESVEREWDSLTESEKQARIEVARAHIEANLSEWATRGDDGIWRRKDNQAVVEPAEPDEAFLIHTAKVFAHHGTRLTV